MPEKLTRQGVRDLGNNSRRRSETSFFDVSCKRGIHQIAGQNFQQPLRHEGYHYGTLVKRCGHCEIVVETFDLRDSYER